MTLTYTIDRAPETVHRKGYPVLSAWTVKQAARTYARADPAHRNMITKADAGRLCKLYYGMALDEAVAKGLV